MKFMTGGKLVTLKGDPGLVRAQTSLKSISKALRDGGGRYLIELGTMGVLGRNSDLTPLCPAPISEVLAKYGAATSGSRPCHPFKEGTSPINVCPYRYPQAQKEAIEKLVDDMLRVGIIQPSVSPCSSPMLLVRKKDGSWRFCVDYRALNRATVADKFSIPVIDELLDELHGANVFMKLNLRSGYHQIRVTPEDVPKTGFRTHDGHYEFLVMPFGLTNAPATFQFLMNTVFKPYLRRFVLVFFDDILVYSANMKDHLRHLDTVMEELRSTFASTSGE